jgi:DNA-binding XRE family transcriptional regulator
MVKRSSMTPPGGRSKAARAGAALAARLFGVRAKESGMRRRDDVQACIRAALRRRRRSLGLTQADMARLLDMRRLTYHRIETGVRRIRFVELAALCEVLQCHAGELLQDGQLTASYLRAERLLDDRAAVAPR